MRRGECARDVPDWRSSQGRPNPAFTLPPAMRFGEALSNVPFTVGVRLFPRRDILPGRPRLPVPTPMETWGDDIAPVGHGGRGHAPPSPSWSRSGREVDGRRAARGGGGAGGESARALPWKSMRDCIEKIYGGPGEGLEKGAPGRRRLPLRRGPLARDAEMGRSFLSKAPPVGGGRPSTPGNTRCRCTCTRPPRCTTGGEPTSPGSRNSRTPSPRRCGGTGWS
jgi:hypothetical protein